MTYAPRCSTGILLLAALAVIVACKDTKTDENVVRGKGLEVLKLRDDAEAALYRAAARAAFNVGPGLTLLVHPRRLPRTAGLEGGDPLPSGLITTLRDRGVVQGTCEPPVGRDTPQCSASGPGYVIRGSEVFRGAGDTAVFYFLGERYATAATGRQDALRFEKIFQLVPRGNEWRVAREARAPESGQQ